MPFRYFIQTAFVVSDEAKIIFRPRSHFLNLSAIKLVNVCQAVHVQVREMRIE